MEEVFHLTKATFTNKVCPEGTLPHEIQQKWDTYLQNLTNLYINLFTATLFRIKLQIYAEFFRKIVYLKWIKTFLLLWNDKNDVC